MAVRRVTVILALLGTVPALVAATPAWAVAGPGSGEAVGPECGSSSR